MKDFTTAREILQLLDTAKDCIKLQYSLSFTTSGERRARTAALRLIDIVSSKVVMLMITNPNDVGDRWELRGGMEVGTPTKREE